MAAGAVFVTPDGQSAAAAIRAEIQAFAQPTTGDLLYVGQIFRSRIRQRTFQGVDVNGAPFAPYSSKGPFYFYPNKGSATSRTSEGRKARATAAANRHAKTGRIGIRTSTGIKYESYAAAKSAHGVSNVNLYGMEQHTHMLDTIIVKAGGAEITQAAGEFMNTGSDLSAFEQNTPGRELSIGFYGPEAERARGHNEGTAKLPKREFFALNQEDLQIAERAIAERMMIRARSGHKGPQGGGIAPAALTDSGDRNDWISF